MVECLFVAFKLQILSADMEVCLNQSKIGLFICEY